MTSWVNFSSEKEQIEKLEFPLPMMDEDAAIKFSSNQSEIFLGQLAGFNLIENFSRDMVKPYLQLPEPK